MYWVWWEELVGVAEMADEGSLFFTGVRVIGVAGSLF